MSPRKNFEGYIIPTAEKADWYCLLVFNESYLTVLQQKLQAEGHASDLEEVYIPKRVIRTTRRGEVVEAEEEPFGYYVFIKAKMSYALYWGVIELGGCSWLHCDTTKLEMPPVVPAEEIERVRVDFSKIDITAVADIRVGSLVEVVSGPLKNYRGIVQEVKDRASIETWLFGRSIQVEIDFASLEVLPEEEKSIYHAMMDQIKSQPAPSKEEKTTR